MLVSMQPAFPVHEQLNINYWQVHVEDGIFMGIKEICLKVDERGIARSNDILEH